MFKLTRREMLLVGVGVTVLAVVVALLLIRRRSKSSPAAPAAPSAPMPTVAAADALGTDVDVTGQATDADAEASSGTPTWWQAVDLGGGGGGGGGGDGSSSQDIGLEISVGGGTTRPPALTSQPTLKVARDDSMDEEATGDDSDSEQNPTQTQDPAQDLAQDPQPTPSPTSLPRGSLPAFMVSTPSAPTLVVFKRRTDGSKWMQVVPSNKGTPTMRVAASRAVAARSMDTLRNEVWAIFPAANAKKGSTPSYYIRSGQAHGMYVGANAACTRPTLQKQPYAWRMAHQRNFVSASAGACKSAHLGERNGGMALLKTPYGWQISPLLTKKSKK